MSGGGGGDSSDSTPQVPRSRPLLCPLLLSSAIGNGHLFRKKNIYFF
ncbi:uncharacterized protein G2W53_001199 [Senna tora]|uniref:Uncharacterized protein n=1 Tax=Senna tora TaxID=362788 RepID=A0A834XH70_9FABA|nr:uncharacterized protein G2W53_001199 [Senna tora]